MQPKFIDGNPKQMQQDTNEFCTERILNTNMTDQNNILRWEQKLQSYHKALNRLVELSSGAQASLVQKMFSSHPDSALRAEKIRKKADSYKAEKK